MNQERIGKFIAEIRKQSKMTQKELADQIGVSDKTISKWECGKSVPDISYLDSICNSLNISINELVSGERLSESSFCKKAEENIMELMKENEKNKKRSVGMVIIGVLLAILALFLTLANTQYGWKQLIMYYIDLPTFVLLALLGVAVVLLTGKRTYVEVLDVLQKTAIPIGVLITMISVIIVLTHLDDAASMGVNISVCIIAVIYSVIEYLIVVILRQRVK